MKKNILFFGTPEFALHSLRSLYENQKELNYTLKGVVTISDKISGRGQKKKQSVIKEEAIKLNLQVFDPINMRDPQFVQEIKKLNLDISVVVAFKKIPKIIYEIPKLGTINLHASLLPQYRGAAPINWAIVNGETKTGLTTFFINEKIDTGDIIMQSEVPISIQDHVIETYNLLKDKSIDMIKETIRSVFQNSYKRKKQKINQENSLNSAPKITKDHLKLEIEHFEKHPLIKLYNYIRGMSNYGVKINIIYIKYKSEIQEEIKKTIIITRINNYYEEKQVKIKNKIHFNTTQKNQIIITNGKSLFNIEKLKTENGKEMSAKEFYNGFINGNHQLNKIIFDRSS